MSEVFTVKQVAAMMGLSRQTVTTLFESEPGVLVLERHQPGKRAYRSIRIPRGVYERVLRRWSV
ncbi:MAG TPA: hypothetical protein VF011_02805 [Terriglobales bacterium]